MKRTFLGLAPLTLAVVSLTFACGDDDPTGDGDGDPTGDGDTDDTGDTGDTMGDGDGDPTGDGDGDPTGDGDGDTTGGPDGDMDGIPDGADNCPDDPNPNQLDFDDNGTGNVCDVQVFATVGGTLNTTGAADAGFAGSCDIPLMIEVLSGQVLVQLDDDAAIAGFEIVNLEVADIPDQVCMLAIEATVSLTDFQIANSGGEFPVSVAHTPAMHDAGSVAGDSDMPHPVLSTATILASTGGGDPMESPLELDGALPIFTANITGAGAMGTLAWADPNFVIASTVFMIEEPIAIDVNFELRGLVGSITLAP